MMMKLLPLVTVVVAEKRFLSAAGTGKSRIDANKNLKFDTVVNNDAGDAAATDAFSITSEAFFLGAKDAANRPKGLVDGTSYRLAAPASVTDAAWKKQSRLVQAKAGSGGGVITDDTQLPNCDNTFVEGAADSSAGTTKGGIHPASYSGDASTNISLTVASMSDAGFAKDDFVYYACKAGKTAHANLTCGTVYKLDTLASESAPLLKSDGTAGPKGGASHAATVVGDTWWLEVQSATPKTLSVCTAKASTSRMAAFVSGLIAYALLI